MSTDIYQLARHPHGCHCNSCYSHRPEPTVTPQTPMATLTVGSAPVHCLGEGVVETSKIDNFGRTIVTYTVDPSYVKATSLTAFTAELASAALADRHAFVTELFSQMAGSSLLVDANGRVLENDSLAGSAGFTLISAL